jgi:hypothetical protein
MTRTSREPVDWREVERIMRLSVRGTGYVPDNREQKTIMQARREDLERYRSLHASVKGEADEEVRLR